MLGGAFLLVTRAIKPRRIYREIDGPLLILFAGMFVVVAGAERALLTPDHIAMVKTLGLDVVWRLSVFTAVLSNVVSNVPAVLALRPFVPTFADPQRAWLTVAMSSTLAGNFTLIGSVDAASARTTVVTARRTHKPPIAASIAPRDEDYVPPTKTARRKIGRQGLFQVRSPQEAKCRSRREDSLNSDEGCYALLGER